MTHTVRMPGLTAEMALRTATTSYRVSRVGEFGSQLTPQAGFGVPRDRRPCIPDWMCQCLTPGPGCPCCQDDVPTLPPFLPRRRW
jgi:hypothetical protein